jgi:hypothetical protein
VAGYLGLVDPKRAVGWSWSCCGAVTRHDAVVALLLMRQQKSVAWIASTVTWRPSRRMLMEPEMRMVGEQLQDPVIML